MIERCGTPAIVRLLAASCLRGKCQPRFEVTVWEPRRRLPECRQLRELAQGDGEDPQVITADDLGGVGGGEPAAQHRVDRVREAVVRGKESGSTPTTSAISLSPST
jgi:hypothetical protein